MIGAINKGWPLLLVLLACACSDEQEKAKLKEEAANATAEARRLTAELVKTDAEADKLARELAPKKAKADQLAIALRDAELEADRVAKRVKRLKSGLATAQTTLGSAAKRFPDIFLEAAHEKRAETRDKPKGPFRAKITAIDAETKLVTIDAGATHGLKKGQKLAVTRGDDYIGRIVLEDVAPDRSTARRARGLGKPIQVGDAVAPEAPPGGP